MVEKWKTDRQVNFYKYYILLGNLFFFRCRLGVAMLGGKLYACGGYDGSSFLQTVEMFDPNTNK